MNRNSPSGNPSWSNQAPRSVTPTAMVTASGWDNRPRRRFSWLKGFLWGTFVGAAGLAAAGYHYRDQLPLRPAAAPPPPIELDGDSIQPVGPQDLAARAEAGDAMALAELESKDAPTRSAREVVALTLGREKVDTRRAVTFTQTLAKQSSASDAELEQLFRLINDEHLYRPTLLALAEGPSALGPDLLFQTLERAKNRPEVAQLAHDLLISADVRKSASPALTVVIDAETTKECSAVRDLVARAEKNGDIRAVVPMARFAERSGCGENGREDCFPCLREDRALVDALRSAQERPAPR